MKVKLTELNDQSGVLTEAIAISADGTTVVGRYIDASNNSVGFVAAKQSFADATDPTGVVSISDVDLANADGTVLTGGYASGGQTDTTNYSFVETPTSFYTASAPG